ncbi:MAG: hypothetical protein M1837_003511 [Sclerophora amabilis]|nr:MAG: hypothetical protein M1837_003511 [Sclerophora amabilis]
MENSPKEMPPNDDLGPAMLEAIWIEAAIAIAVMMARLYARIRIVRQVSLDDYLMITSLVFAIISGGIITEGVVQGFGKHIFYLAPHQQIQAIKFAYLSQPFNAMAQCFGRMSFALFLVRVMGITALRRWILYSIICGQFAVNIVFSGLTLAACRPINRYWDPTVSGSCWSPLVIEYAGYSQGAWNVFSDFVLALLPGIIVWSLNMKVTTKIGLVILLALGVFNMIAAIITMVKTKVIAADQDITYNYVILDIWGHKQVDDSHENGSISSFRDPKKMDYTAHSDTSHQVCGEDDFASVGKSEDHILPMHAPNNIRKTTKVSVSYRPSQTSAGSDGYAKEGHLNVNHIVPFDTKPAQPDDRV